MSGEKTEAATPKRLEEMRGEGKAPRSQELGSSIGLLVACIILQNTVAAAAGRMQGLLSTTFSDFGTTGRVDDPGILWAEQVLGRATDTWLVTLAPLMLVLPILGVGIGFAQGHIVSFKAMMHFGALNPMTGFKRLFSMQSLVGLGRSLAKVGFVGALTWRALQDTAARLPTVDGSTDPRIMAGFIAQGVLNVGIPAAEVLMLLAVGDYAYQRYTFNKGARMSKQDVKQEHKQEDGDPQVKGQIRSRQRKMAMARRQMEDVPTATVVVTNPTHIAVALKYDQAMPSPKVVAMGADLLAERIKNIAREAHVPMVENITLARGLFKSVEIGDEIPLELYQAVAEVLAYVYSLKKRRRRQ